MIPRHCVKCNHPIRPAQVTIAKAPGTRQHRAHGLCKNCYYVERSAGTIPEPSSRGRKPADPELVQFTYRFDEKQASAALESWLRERRHRLARNAA